MNTAPGRPFLIPLLAAITLILSLASAGMVGAAPPAKLPALDDDPERWVGGAPITLDDLEGKVALVHVWTFQCWNCYRSFPWLNALEQNYDKVQFVGIHTPEFESEKVKSTVVAKNEEFGLQHPSMLDNDMAYWRQLNNRYWPAWYLVDREGRIRHVFIGETHAGNAQAKKIAAALDGLLAESEVGVQDDVGVAQPSSSRGRE